MEVAPSKLECREIGNSLPVDFLALPDNKQTFLDGVRMSQDHLNVDELYMGRDQIKTVLVCIGLCTGVQPAGNPLPGQWQ